MARRSLGTEYAHAPFGDIQINLQDALLVKNRLKHQRDNRLLCLADIAALPGQKQVFRQLLCDGRATGYGLAFFLVFFNGTLDALPVEALVIDKLHVFGSNNRPFEVSRNFRVGNPVVLQPRIGIFSAQLLQTGRHEARAARRLVFPVKDVRAKPGLRQKHREHDSGEGVTEHLPGTQQQFHPCTRPADGHRDTAASPVVTGYSPNNLSPGAKVQVRVMTRTSVSLRMSGGNAE